MSGGRDNARRFDSAVASFVEMLRKTDPEAAKKFVALSDTRNRNLEEVKHIQAEIKTATSEQKAKLYPQFKAANKRYLESYLVYLDFVDEIDRTQVQRHLDAIAKIKAVLDKRKAGRAEIEKALKEQE